VKRGQFINAIASTIAVPGIAWSQASSSQRPTTIVVGFAPGGSVGLVARLVAEQMQKRLGRPFIIENRTGAAGRLAPEQVKLAVPDGQTLMIVPHGPMTLFPFIYKQLKFDP
jgi:tripartite-type tricarboxylate transporter receptor subunit TctC